MITASALALVLQPLTPVSRFPQVRLYDVSVIRDGAALRQEKYPVTLLANDVIRNVSGAIRNFYFDADHIFVLPRGASLTYESDGGFLIETGKIKFTDGNESPSVEKKPKVYKRKVRSKTRTLGSQGTTFSFEATQTEGIVTTTIWLNKGDLEICDSQGANCKNYFQGEYLDNPIPIVFKDSMPVGKG